MRLPAWPTWLRRGDAARLHLRLGGTVMLIARWVVMLLLLAAVVCFAMFIGTRDRRYLAWGLVIVKWTVLAGLAFFGVLILERLALMV